MLHRIGVLTLSLLFCLLLTMSATFAQDETQEAPVGDIDAIQEETEETDSWLTTQYIGNAPGMDQYRWYNEDFGWIHTFDAHCKKIHDVQLRIRAWDVDYAGGERDAIYADGVFLGYLHGSASDWHTTTFDVNPALLADHLLRIWVDIDQTHKYNFWAVTIDWSALRTHWDWLPPVANFYATPVEGIGPLHVCFKNLSTCASHYLWDFGDGTTSTLKHPCHVFDPVQKYYTVKLTAWGCGGQDMMVKENYIQVNKQVQVNFAATSLVGPGVGFFNNCGGSANHFKWEYGDGTIEEYTSDVRKAIDPEHRYNETVAGEYDVTLTAWGNGGMDKLTIPNMIYVNPDYLFYPLTFIEGSKTYPGDGWACIADHNPVKGVGAVWGDAEATFALSDSCQIHFLRMLPDSYLEREFVTTIVDKFEIWLSLDGVNFEKTLTANSTAKQGDWEIFMLTTPKNAKWLKIKLVSARGEQTKNVMKPKHIEVVELQVFGKAYQPIVAFGKNLAGANGTIPTDFTLAQNFPNPFNPATSIRYELPEKAEVMLTIYNLQGQRVQTLAQGQMDAGVYDLQWNACDYNGSPVATGIYIYQFHAKGETKSITFTRKMTFMK